MIYHYQIWRLTGQDFWASSNITYLDFTCGPKRVVLAWQGHLKFKNEISFDIPTDAAYPGMELHTKLQEYVDNIGIDSATNTQLMCTCDIKILMDHGCQCGGFAAEQAAQKGSDNDVA